VCVECQELKGIDLQRFILVKTDNAIIRKGKTAKGVVVMPKCACEQRELTVSELVQLFGIKKISLALWESLPSTEK